MLVFMLMAGVSPSAGASAWNSILRITGTGHRHAHAVSVSITSAPAHHIHGHCRQHILVAQAL